jgi:addiction module RelE/StbE family toxin
MYFVYSPQFRKQYKKLSQKIQTHVDARLRLFIEEPYHPQLQNHKLHGEYASYRSINVTGDLRVVYALVGDEATLLFALGTHSELYE